MPQWHYLDWARLELTRLDFSHKCFPLLHCTLSSSHYVASQWRPLRSDVCDKVVCVSSPLSKHELFQTAWLNRDYFLPLIVCNRVRPYWLSALLWTCFMTSCFLQRARWRSVIYLFHVWLVWRRDMWNNVNIHVVVAVDIVDTTALESSPSWHKARFWFTQALVGLFVGSSFPSSMPYIGHNKIVFVRMLAFTGCLYLKGLPVVMHNFTRVFIIIVVTPYLGICKPLRRQRSLVFSIILLTIRPMTPFLDEWATFISVHLLLCPRAQNTLVTPLLADVVNF